MPKKNLYVGGPWAFLIKMGFKSNANSHSHLVCKRTVNAHAEKNESIHSPFLSEAQCTVLHCDGHTKWGALFRLSNSSPTQKLFENNSNGSFFGGFSALFKKKYVVQSLLNPAGLILLYVSSFSIQ